MPRKKTHEKFLEEVKALVGDEYEVIGKYINAATNIGMKHKVCGHEYDVRPQHFLKGCRCPKCSGKMKKTTEIFKGEVFELVGNEYEVVGKYNRAKTKIEMKHNVCGCIYNVTPNDFLRGRRCPKCSIDKSRNKKKMSAEGIKEKFRRLAQDEYSILGDINVENLHGKINVKHNKCNNIYKVRIHNFFNGRRCPECRYRKVSAKLRISHTEFLQKFLSLANNEYLLLSKYNLSRDKIKVKHVECGSEFYIKANNFLNGGRCPHCKSSKGEKKIKQHLDSYSIDYNCQYRFSDCRNTSTLPFDFIVFNDDGTINCLIEYDGQQHYHPIDFFGGEKGFKQRQHNDQIKTQYCKDNNIKLIRIPYWDFDNIEDILNDELKDVISSGHCTQQAS